MEQSPTKTLIYFIISTILYDLPLLLTQALKIRSPLKNNELYHEKLAITSTKCPHVSLRNWRNIRTIP